MADPHDISQNAQTGAKTAPASAARMSHEPANAERQRAFPQVKMFSVPEYMARQARISHSPYPRTSFKAATTRATSSSDIAGKIGKLSTRP